MDVEGILKQIRERVVLEPAVRPNDTGLTSSAQMNGSAGANHDDALQRLRTQLAIAGRAADRLPPVFSNRQGTRARFELWLKHKSKPLTRWFTWEQVNFNRAVSDALADVVEILKSEAQELAALRAQLNAWQTQLTQQTQEQIAAIRDESRDQITELQSHQSRLEERLLQADARFAQLEGATTERHARLAAEYQSLLAEHTKLAEQVIELADQLRAEDREIRSAQDEEINRRLSQLAAELNEEQRVCFRQISLETGEASALEDRARRGLLARVEQLEAVLKKNKG